MKTTRDLVKFGLQQLSLVELDRALYQCRTHPDKILLTGMTLDYDTHMY